MQQHRKAALRPQSPRAVALPTGHVTKPSAARTAERRVTERHERLVSAWLRSLSAR